VLKSARRTILHRYGRMVRTCDIASIAQGFAPKGHKTTEGNGRTPEGLYPIDARNPHSSFHLSLRISYPNAADQVPARGRAVEIGTPVELRA
jgi:murein L,D-transpeptidase YafK